MDRLEALGVGAVAGAFMAPWVGGTAWAWGFGVLGAVAMAYRIERVIADAIVGVCIGLLAVATVTPGWVVDGDRALVGVVTAPPSGHTALLEVRRMRAPGEAWEHGVGRVALVTAEPLGVGDTVMAWGRASMPQDRVLPGAPDPADQSMRTGIERRFRARLVQSSTTETRPPRRAHPVLVALATGDRSGIDPDTWDVFRRTGTAHLLAISGFHVGLVAWLVFATIRRMMSAVALVRPVGLSSAWAVIVGALVGVAYALAAGAPVSAQRASVLVLLVAVGHALGRQVRPASLLGLTATALVVWEPGVVGTPGFQLSFGAVIALVRIAPVLMRWLPPDLPWPVQWVYTGAASTVAATLGTLPASAWWFQELAPWSVLTNLFAMPFTAFVVAPCALAGMWGPEPVRGLALSLGDPAVRLLLGALRPFAVTPWAAAAGGWGVLGLCTLPWLFRYWGAVFGALILAFGFVVVDPTAMRITFLAVGQGDAALVEWPDGRRWLVDGGPPSTAVLAWLRRRHVRHLDVVVATHGQADHVGGLVPVVNALSVGEVWVGGEEPGLWEIIKTANAGGVPVVHAPSPAMHPDRDFQSDEPNDHSIVLQVSHRGMSALLTGDIETRAEQAVLVWAGHVDVVKVPHHGSRTSSSEALVQALSPTVAVIGVGRDNLFGHPNPEVVDRYEVLGTRVYRTDVDGTVQVRLGDGSVQVRTWLPGRGWSGFASYAVFDPAPSWATGTGNASAVPWRVAQIPTAQTTINAEIP